MVDKCAFCGGDVSDLNVHVCSSCANKSQGDPLVKEIQSYRFKLNRLERHRMIYLKKLGELYWYQSIQRRLTEKIIEMHTQLIEAYSSIITILEKEEKFRTYKTMGGNINPNQMTFNIEEK